MGRATQKRKNSERDIDMSHCIAASFVFRFHRH